MTAPTHPLTDAEAHTICCVLRSQHITVTVAVINGVAYINTVEPVTTRQEVQVLRAFQAVTDAFAWHPTTDQAVTA